MAKHILMAFNRPKAGEEASFDTWYDEVHIPEILAVPGLVSARRFTPVRTNLAGSEAWTNVAQYEIETDDLSAVLQALQASLSPFSAVDASNSANLIASERFVVLA